MGTVGERDRMSMLRSLKGTVSLLSGQKSTLKGCDQQEIISKQFGAQPGRADHVHTDCGTGIQELARARERGSGRAPLHT